MDSAHPRPATARDYRERILRVLVFIQSHLDDAVCLDDLAALSNFSPFHFHRVFRGMVGESVMEHVRPYDQVGQTWSKLMSWDGPRGLLGPQTRPFGLSYDDPAVTPPDKVRYDACINVGPAARAEGQVGVRDLPGGEYAIAVHLGSYDRLTETYAMLYGQWLPASGHRPADPPSIERYLNDPRMTPPEQLLTEVCIPLA